MKKKIYCIREANKTVQEPLVLRGVTQAAIVVRRVAAETQSTRHRGGVSPTIYVAAVRKKSTQTEQLMKETEQARLSFLSIITTNKARKLKDSSPRSSGHELV
jgi:hypothetical protein